MNAYLITSIFLACLVTWSHGRALKTALVHQSNSELERKKAWNRHLVTNGILWLVLFADVLALQFILPRQDLPPLTRLLGLIMILGGVALVAWTRILLGRDQAMGNRFYFPHTTRKVLVGPFPFVRNPMYDGFILILVGLGLSLGIYGDLVLAGVSFLLLNVWLARIENSGL